MLTHIDEKGQARMVDITTKPESSRKAVAQGQVQISEEVSKQIQSNSIAKGNVLQVARCAAIMAAKRTDELIPLCHTLPVDSIIIDFYVKETCIEIEATVRVLGKTGVEMEALTAATVAALTIYDMCKAVDKKMVIGPIFLKEKTGGKSGPFRREDDV